MRVFITHYSTEKTAILNKVTLDVALNLRRETDHVTVVGWTETEDLWRKIIQGLPTGCDAVFNDRKGRPDTQPSLRNKVLELARLDGDRPFCLLHNDVRAIRGCFDRVWCDLFASEWRWGYGSSIISFRYVPFMETVNAELWRQVRSAGLHESNLLYTVSEMANWCVKNDFINLLSTGLCDPWQPPRDVGHQLMMFVTRPSFFDEIGECDENFVAVNLDDTDWGIRTLQAGKRSLVSETALLGHIEGLSFTLQGWSDDRRNEDVFRKKWGDDVFREVADGSIWKRLHNDEERK